MALSEFRRIIQDIAEDLLQTRGIALDVMARRVECERDI
jgi:hypothetical protein